MVDLVIRSFKWGLRPSKLSAEPGWNVLIGRDICISLKRERIFRKGKSLVKSGLDLDAFEKVVGR